MAYRQRKANEFINSLKNNNMKMSDFGDFGNILDEWVHTGNPISGEQFVPPIKRYLIYQLSDIKHTYIKLSLKSLFSQQPTVIQKENKVGRNALCPCQSGKKYKKCCEKNR